MENNQELHPYKPGLLPFDPIVIVRDVIRRWFAVVVTALIVGMCAYVIRDGSYSPVYQANATLVVTARDSSSSIFDNISSTSSLATVFSEVINSSVLRTKILEELDLSGFSGTISASLITNTNLISLSVQGNDPRTVFLVIQAVIDNHEVVTKDVIGNVTIEVLQAPVVPVSPINNPDAGGMMKKAVLLSGVLACIVLAFMSYNRDMIRSRNEAEQKLGCWCLGEIHHERKYKTLSDYIKRRKKSILITKPETGFRYVTTIEKLRHRVQQHMHGGKVLMVTSVMENEGKSTVAANLALAMAKKHGRVLLIDCDFHKPACHKILGVGRVEHWLNDVINGAAGMEEAVIKEKLCGLQMLLAKKASNQTAGDLINSARLNQLIRQAKETYDFVIIDLPPMSVSTDTECVMEYADASLLVVRQNQVNAAAANQAINVLQKGKAKLLGCVLNNVYSTFLTSGVGYDAGYGKYGGYSKYGKYGKYGHYGAKYTN